jgi:RNA polymerase sporulation-specific sigma factor
MIFLPWRQKLLSFLAKIRLAVFSEGMDYISNTDYLPRPLTPEQENEILQKLPDHPELRQVLVERNLRLVVFLARKFENTGVGLEDLISIGTIGLIKAIKTFCPDKNIKLATYASRCIENEILMYLRKVSGRHEISIDEPLNVDFDGNELLLSDLLADDGECVYRKVESEEEKRVIREAISRLGDREKQIIEMRFGLSGGNEMTQKEVADSLGISQSYISRLEKKIIEKLRLDIGEKI